MTFYQKDTPSAKTNGGEGVQKMSPILGIGIVLGCGAYLFTDKGPLSGIFHETSSAKD